MKLKVRFIDVPGSPGEIEEHERNDLEEMLTGSDAIVYVNFERVSTDPLIIPDNAEDITVITAPQGVTTAIVLGVVLLVAAIGAGVAYSAYIQNQIASATVDITSYSGSAAKSIRGSNNSYRADGLVPLVLGNMYIVPDWCGAPYTSYADDEQWFHQLFCFGYSELSLSDLKIGDNDLSNYEESHAEDITYYPLLISETAINVELSYDEGALTYTTPENTTQINVGITFPGGLRSYDSNGNTQSHNVSFTIRYRIDGTTTWTENNVTISGDKDYSRTMYEYSVTSGQYEVQVERTTADTSSGTILDTSYWDVMQALLDNDGSSAPLSSGFQSACKILSLKIKATNQLNGIIDELNAVAQLTCRDWNGLGSGATYWVSAETRNPASVLLYVLTNSNASQKPVDDTEIEWDEFEELHDWCETKGFNFDASLTGDYTESEVISLIETAGRFKMTKYNGVYGIRIEKASSDVNFVLTPRNCAGSMTETKPFNVTTKNLECTFIDRDSGFVEVTRTCSLDPDGDIVYDDPQDGDTESIDFIGITDSEHMMKIAAFELAKYLRRNISYTVPLDYEQLTMYPGAVGYLSNDMFLYSLGWGKVVSYTGSAGAITGIYVDFEATMESGTGYAVILRMNDESDGVQIININNALATTKYLEFLSSVSYDIQPGNMVVFGEQGAEALKVICESIQSGDEKGGTVTLQPYAEEIYDADSGTIPAWVSGVTIPAAGGTGVDQTAATINDLLNKIADNNASTPTYDDLNDGYDTEDSGGTPTATTTPDAPVLTLTPISGGIRLDVDKQTILTNFLNFRFQVSLDEVSWYALGMDGTDWKTGSAGGYTEWPVESLFHINIPAIQLSVSGTTTSGSDVITGISDTSPLSSGDAISGTGIPSGATIDSVDSSSQITISDNATASGTVTLTIGDDISGSGDNKKYMGAVLSYRVARVTKLSVVSNWSTVQTEQAGQVDPNSVAANSINVNQLTTNILEAIYATVQYQYVMGFAGIGGSDDPEEGDRRIYMDGDELIFQTYTSGAWSSTGAVKLGGEDAGGNFDRFLKANGAIHPNAAGINYSNLGDVLPGGYLFRFDSDLLDDSGDYTFGAGSLSTVWYKFGLSSVTNTGSTTVLTVANTDNNFQDFSLQNSFSMAFWFYRGSSSTATDSSWIFYLYQDNDTDPDIEIDIVFDRSDNGIGIKATYYDSPNVSVSDLDVMYLNDDQTYYIGLCWDVENEELSLLVDGSVISTIDVSTIMGSFTPASVALNAYLHQYEYADELLLAPMSLVDSSKLISHYGYGRQWSEDYSDKDEIIRPESGGKIVLDGEVRKPSDRINYTQTASFDGEEKTFVFPETVTEAKELTVNPSSSVDEESVFYVKNKSEYTQTIIDYNNSSNEYKVAPGQRVMFRVVDSALTWASPDWELIKDFGGTATSGTHEVDSGFYKLTILGSTTTRFAMLHVDTAIAQALGVWEPNYSASYVTSSPFTWATGLASYYVDKLYKWHEAA